jgi:hypothetical protein
MTTSPLSLPALNVYGVLVPVRRVSVASVPSSVSETPLILTDRRVSLVAALLAAADI